MHGLNISISNMPVFVLAVVTYGHQVDASGPTGDGIYLQRSLSFVGSFFEGDSS